MGRTHATSGALAYLAVVPPLAAAADLPTSAVALLLGAVAAAGAAMLPDLDHPQAGVARALGPATGLLARVVAAVSGGHRHATHSLFGVVVAAAFTAAVVAAGPIAAGVWLAFLLAIASSAMGIQTSRHQSVHTVLCLAGAVVVITTLGITGLPLGVLVPAVAIGAAAHVAGDMLTSEGCPLLWPLSARVAVARIRTGGVVETWLVAPVFGVAAVVLGWIHLHEDLPREVSAIARQLVALIP